MSYIPPSPPFIYNIKNHTVFLASRGFAPGGMLHPPQMRDAYMALVTAKERMGRTEILHKYNNLMAEKFVRTEPLGVDREGRRYWVFEGDSRYMKEHNTLRIVGLCQKR